MVSLSFLYRPLYKPSVGQQEWASRWEIRTPTEQQKVTGFQSRVNFLGHWLIVLLFRNGNNTMQVFHSISIICVYATSIFLYLLWNWMILLLFSSVSPRCICNIWDIGIGNVWIFAVYQHCWYSPRITVQIWVALSATLSMYNVIVKCGKPNRKASQKITRSKSPYHHISH